MSPDNINYGRDQNIFNQPQNVHFYPPQEQPRDPVLQTLLESVQREVKARLAKSLHRAVDATLLNLGKALEPHQVRSPWAMEMSVQERPPQPLSPEMTISQVFELPDVGQKLLILGEPGSGKTTTLLELAQTLVERALINSDASIPILVSLSSWKDPKQSIFNWLIKELKSKYGLRNKELGRKFLVQKCFLPLLDGLDEVAPDHQEACAVKLNTWLEGDVEQKPVGTVVCCRRKEYEEIVQKRLFLHNSVALQPLNDNQIEAYLTQFQLSQVWESIQASSQLQDLLRKPLFLAVFGFIAQQFNFSEWKKRTTDAERTEYLFDRYWDAAMGRVLVDTKNQDQGIQSNTYGKRGLPNRKKVRRAIVFAAKGMEKELQVELLIEKTQPNWLRNELQKWKYRLIFVLLIALIGGLVGGLIGQPIEGLIFMPIFLLIKGLIRGLFRWLYFGGGVLGLAGLRPVAWMIRGLFGWLNLPDDVLLMLLVVLIGGLVVALIGGLVVALIFGLLRWLIFAPIVGLTGWLFVELTGLLLRGLKADIEVKNAPNQGIKNSRQNMFVLTGTALLIAIPLKLLLELLMASILPAAQLSTVVAASLFCLIGVSFLEGGGETLLKHVALRIVLAWHGYAPYRYDKLLDYCTERLLLQRIGGRYRFMHKLLQEHFAKMPLD